MSDIKNDTIKRSNAVEVVYKALKTPPLKGALTDTMSLAIAMVQDIPSADRPSAVDLSSVYSTAYKSGYEKGKADRAQGEWIVSDDKCFHTCQFCNAEVDVSMGTGIFVNNDEVSHMNFCPNCGARMKGADDESVDSN